MSWSSKHPAVLIEEIRALHSNLLTIQERNDKPCDHYTVRPGYLPCPHPKCTELPRHAADTLRIVRWKPGMGPGFTWLPEEGVSPTDTAYDEEIWLRKEVQVLPFRDRLWAWVKVK